MRTWTILLAGVVAAVADAADAARPDPAIAIPFCTKAPTLDGKLDPGEWDLAAAVGMLEAYPSGWPRAMRQEQAVYYICWDADAVYVAMDSVEASTNRVMARCTQNDNMKVIGDDCMEVMVSPGDRQALEDPDWPTYYIAMNAIGTVWDAMFKPLRAERHNSWQSGIQVAHKVDGTRWVCEARIPFMSIAGPRPEAGTTWRMNFDRTYYAYIWSAWNAGGGLTDARIGGDVTFTRDQAAVRLLGVETLFAGQLLLNMEAANPTAAPRDVTFTVEVVGGEKLGAELTPVATVEKTVTVAPGTKLEVDLGNKQALRPYNVFTIAAADAAGNRLFFLQRDVLVPSPRIPKRAAPDLPLVYVFPRYLPSLDRLTVSVDAVAWLRRVDVEDGEFAARVVVAPKATPDQPVVDGSFTDFAAGIGVGRFSTNDLPEGDYVVKVTVTEKGKELIVHDDWFVKKIFDWMVHPRGVSEEAPAPYTPVVAAGQGIRVWGREYTFAPTGLPTAMVSQQKALLSGPMTLVGSVNGQAVEPKTVQPYRIGKATSGRVETTADSSLGPLGASLESATEFDGLTICRLSLDGGQQPVTVDRLRLRIPLTGKYCRFYSASGDREGTSIQGAVVPAGQGEFYNSRDNTYAVGGYPTFATLLWLGDYDSYFCYAADNPKGWVLRDDAPAVTAAREGDDVVVWLNLVDRPIELTGSRTLEFAFQTGPTKPLPKGWRGIQYGGDPKAAPTTLSLITHSQGYFPLYGGVKFVHPGWTPEMWEKSRDRVAKMAAAGPYTVISYHRWPAAIKGHPATPVFRGEWGIDKAQWDHWKGSGHAWEQRMLGDNRDLYAMLCVNAVPSYLDYLENAYDLALEHTALSGHYDDTGYPISVFDPELGMGYVAEDGRSVASSGLWIYRERWKRQATIHANHQRPDYTADSQHCVAHFQPAYGFVGLWMPCERGYYNHHLDRDNLEFYGSLERYYAYNPSYAFGQPAPGIGLGTAQIRFDLQVRDSRVMSMLALLHDQTIGWFGQRDRRTIYRLREARNIFRQWDDDVVFTGYWQDPHPVKTSNPDVRVSLYRRPGSAMLFVGNIGEAGSTTVAPDWAALGLNQQAAGDPETGQAIAVTNGAFTLAVGRHDIRLVLLGDLDAYPWQPADPGADLPKPATMIAELSDPLRGPALDPAWVFDGHEGNSSTGFVDGRCYVQASHYGFAHIRWPLGQDNVSVQCMILGENTGQQDGFCGGLGLWWENGAYVRVIPAGKKGAFWYETSTKGNAYGGEFSREPVARWYPYWQAGVKIQLTPEAVRFFVSRDGRTWELDREVPRGEKLAGAPAWAILGNGGAQGDAPMFKNIVQRHFIPSRGDRVTVFTDFTVGRD